MESWLSGRKHLTANEAIGNGSEVRILHSPQQIQSIQDGRNEIEISGTQKRRGATALNQYIAGREATDEGPCGNVRM